MDPIGLALVTVGMVLNVGAQVVLKYAVQSAAVAYDDPLSLLKLLATPLALLGLALYAASVVNWLVVLKRLDLGLAYPLMSIGYILTFVIGIWCFREPWSTVRLTGILVIILGVILLSWPVARSAEVPAAQGPSP